MKTTFDIFNYSKWFFDDLPYHGNIKSNVAAIDWANALPTSEPVLAILSTEGNGGTHLLRKVYCEVRNKPLKSFCVNCERLHFLFREAIKIDGVEEFMDSLLQIDVLFIDDLDSSVFMNDVSFSTWLKELIISVLKMGGKIAFTITDFKQEQLVIPNYLIPFGCRIVTSYYPNQLTAKEIIADLFPESESRFKLTEELYNRCSSVRELQGNCLFQNIAKKKRSG